MPWPKDPAKYDAARKRMSKERSGDRNAMFGRKHSEKTKKKMSAAKLLNNPMRGIHPELHPMWGKKHTPAAKAKISKAQTGRPLTLQHRKNIGAALIGHPNIGATLAASKRGESPQERAFKKALRTLNIRYRGHFPVLGRFVADIFLPEYHLLIECDGEYWHSERAPKFNPNWERARDKSIRAAGFLLQRVSNKRIDKNPVEAARWALRKSGVVR